MRWFSLVAVSVGVGACASSPAREEAAATPEETLCFKALIHVAGIVSGGSAPAMDARTEADMRGGCRAPEAQTAAMQQQFRCSLEAKDLPGLEACKAAADATQPTPN